jgi:8-oxo-dGTP diphosphatase
VPALSASGPVAVAVVTSPLGVLAVRRADGRPPWAFPGGKIEPGETPAQAAERECLEETGCVVRAGAALGSREHPVTGRQIVYVAAEPAGSTTVAVTASGEVAEVRWLSAEQASALMTGMHEPVATYLAERLQGC